MYFRLFFLLLMLLLNFDVFFSFFFYLGWQVMGDLNTRFDFSHLNLVVRFVIIFDFMMCDWLYLNMMIMLVLMNLDIINSFISTAVLYCPFLLDLLMLVLLLYMLMMNLFKDLVVYLLFHMYFMVLNVILLSNNLLDWRLYLRMTDNLMALFSSLLDDLFFGLFRYFNFIIISIISNYFWLWYFSSNLFHLFRLLLMGYFFLLLGLYLLNFLVTSMVILILMMGLMVLFFYIFMGPLNISLLIILMLLMGWLWMTLYQKDWVLWLLLLMSRLMFQGYLMRIDRMLKQGYFDLLWFNLAVRLCVLVVMFLFGEILSIPFSLLCGFSALHKKKLYLGLSMLGSWMIGVMVFILFMLLSILELLDLSRSSFIRHEALNLVPFVIWWGILSDSVFVLFHCSDKRYKCKYYKKHRWS